MLGYFTGAFLSPSFDASVMALAGTTSHWLTVGWLLAIGFLIVGYAIAFLYYPTVSEAEVEGR